MGVNCYIEHDSIRTALANIGGLDVNGVLPNEDNYHPNPSQSPKSSPFSSETVPRPKIIIAYANSGERWCKIPPSRRKNGDPAGYWVWPVNSGPEKWASTMINFAVTREMVANQPNLTANQISHNNGLAQWIGGCCRVTPSNILDLAKRIKPGEFPHPSPSPMPQRGEVAGAKGGAIALPESVPTPANTAASVLKRRGSGRSGSLVKRRRRH